ncbi:hypothetical protein ACF3OH_13070 [Chryseomicrobium aureum]|uniref:hypothetical protein n=1 Tax=Chryseomicrobium aureum TaxID=1441723 RepID=UPI00195ACBCC|nr:hypothetical protein [Chryseomicrobium aureum]MBM7706278.1 hypothetical protein [Chryseomicrobium aureum]
MATRWTSKWETILSVVVMLIGLATIGYCAYCFTQAAETSSWLAQLKRFIDRGGLG